MGVVDLEFDRDNEVLGDEESEPDTRPTPPAGGFFAIVDISLQIWVSAECFC